MDPAIELLTYNNKRGDKIPLIDKRFVLQHIADPSDLELKISTSAFSQDLYGTKDLFDKLQQAKIAFGEMKHPLRSRAIGNPYENIPNMFLDRAGLKIAGIDATFPLIPIKTIANKETVQVADIGGAPGAWSEYQLWRAQNDGYDVEIMGISLRDNIPWTLYHSVFNLDTSKLHISYGEDGTGNILNPDNIKEFANACIRKGGLRDLVMGDIGIDVNGKEEQQEQLNTRLILGEILIGLQTLKKGGSLVIKIYEAYTKLMVDVLHLAMAHFEESCLYKCLASRWANSERYLVCKGFIGKPLLKLESLYRVLHDNKITSLFDNPPPNILLYILWMNDYSAVAQIAAIDWTLEVDKQLEKGYSRVIRPSVISNQSIVASSNDNPLSTNNKNEKGTIKSNKTHNNDTLVSIKEESLDLAKIIDLWDLPRSSYSSILKPTLEPLNEPSLCVELAKFHFVAKLVTKVINLPHNIHNTEFVYIWLRYAMAYGLGYHYDETLFNNWTKTVTLNKDLVSAIKDFYTRNTFAIDTCEGPKFHIESLKQIQIVRVTFKNGVLDRSLPLPQGVLNTLISLKEAPPRNIDSNEMFLSRSFILLKRYESLKLLNKAITIASSDIEFDIELYAILPTVSAKAWFSPVFDLEETLGAIGYPLADNSGILSRIRNKNILLNLLSIEGDIALKRDLIENALSIVEIFNTLTVYIYSSIPIDTLDKSKYLLGRETGRGGRFKEILNPRNTIPDPLLYVFHS